MKILQDQTRRMDWSTCLPDTAQRTFSRQVPAGTQLPGLRGPDGAEVPAVAFAAGAGGDEPVAVAGEGKFADGRAAGSFQAGEDSAVGQSDQGNAGISFD
jgi:hypothetical protein